MQSRWINGRGPARVGLIAAGLSPAVALSAAWVLGAPLVVSRWRCGTPEAMLVMLAPFAFALCAMTSAVVVWLATRRGWALVDRILTGAVIGGAFAALALAGLAAARARSKPPPSGWVASLPVVARLPPVETSPRAWSRATDDVSVPDVPDATRDDTAGGVRIHRVCRAGSCEIALERPGDLAPGDGSFGPDDVPRYGGGGSVAASATLFLRHDSAHALWVLEDLDGPELAFREGGRSRFQIDDVTVHDVSSSLSAPRGFIVASFAASAIAAALLVARRRVAASERALASARCGLLGADGWITFDDGGPPVRAPHRDGAADAPDGMPVVLLPRAPSAAHAYRGGDPALDVRAGTLADVTARLAARAAALDAAALAAVLLGAAPLAVAAAASLV